MKNMLFVTDLYYPAKGRIYYLEDLFLTSKLREIFSLSICHPQDIRNFEDIYDLIMIRNVGPIANFKDKYYAFRKRALDKGLKTYNSFTGKGDMIGKDYLLQLTKMGFPVIPTIDTINSIDQLPDVDAYVFKPKDGADSIGMKIVDKHALATSISANDGSILIQPLINFDYEVSFYFVDREFQYAFYAPDKAHRWKLEEYHASSADLLFAQRFIDWNNLDWGIQRIDACRTRQGQLLLVELEDFNPFLSLLDLPSDVQTRFISALTNSLQKTFAT